MSSSSSQPNRSGGRKDSKFLKGTPMTEVEVLTIEDSDEESTPTQTAKKEAVSSGPTSANNSAQKSSASTSTASTPKNGEKMKSSAIAKQAHEKPSSTKSALNLKMSFLTKVAPKSNEPNEPPNSVSQIASPLTKSPKISKEKIARESPTGSSNENMEVGDGERIPVLQPDVDENDVSDGSSSSEFKNEPEASVGVVKKHDGPSTSGDPDGEPSTSGTAARSSDEDEYMGEDEFDSDEDQEEGSENEEDSEEDPEESDVSEEDETSYRNMITLSSYEKLSAEDKKVMDSLLDLNESLDKRIKELQTNPDLGELDDSNECRQLHERIQNFVNASAMTCDRIIALAGIEDAVRNPDEQFESFNFRGSGRSDLDHILTEYTRRWMKLNHADVRRGKAPTSQLTPNTVSDIMAKVSVKRNGGKPLKNERTGVKVEADAVHYDLHLAVIAHRQYRFTHQTIPKFATDEDLANFPKDKNLEKKFKPSTIGESSAKYIKSYEQQKKREGFKVSNDDNDQGEVVETSSDEDENAVVGEQEEEIEDAEDDEEQMEVEEPEVGVTPIKEENKLSAGSEIATSNEDQVPPKSGAEISPNQGGISPAQSGLSGLITDDESDAENKKKSAENKPEIPAPRSSLKRASSPPPSSSSPKISKP